MAKMADQSSPQVPETANSSDIEEGRQFVPQFDSHGNMPAVVTDATSGDVLMLAWMNEEALLRTIETGQVHFYSRSRRKIWMKGEESGNVMHVEEMRTDCDQDAIWIRARVAGRNAACHTGRRTCFYRAVAKKGVGNTNSVDALDFVVEERVFDPKKVYGKNDT